MLEILLSERASSVIRELMDVETYGEYQSSSKVEYFAKHIEMLYDVSLAVRGEYHCKTTMLARVLDELNGVPYRYQAFIDKL